MNIAIVGAGDMGKWLAGVFKKIGGVTISDIRAERAGRAASALDILAMPAGEAVREADLILIAIPISKTPDAVKSLSRIVKRGALLVDVASVKTDVVKAMRSVRRKVELVSLHPLFGPGAASIKGKDIVAIPVRAGDRYQELKRTLEMMGARITEMDEREHDQIMAVTQCLTHFVLIAYLKAIKSIKWMKQAEKLSTPMFSSFISLVKAILAGNPDLYGELQVHNKYAGLMRNTMMEACRSLNAALSTGDVRALRALFDESLTRFNRNDIERAYREIYRRFEEATE